MLYTLIAKKRDRWFASPECPAKALMDYICSRGKMRDAQREAIGTYLFLKIGCGNKPLWRLFAEGAFNSIAVEDLELSVATRATFDRDPAAVALFEYARLRDKNGRQVAPELERLIRTHAADIDYRKAFRELFYGVTYTDYLFSLPMGAGKTFLMAAFIYIDLYYALSEPANPAFAHNFMIFAPSGLKSSIVPSLRHIMEFDPSWVIPEPYASEVRRRITFEVLDEQKASSRSNIVRNPNAQKINNHQPLDELIGLVAITNAEKVILDRVDKDMDSKLFTADELTRIAQANELRDIIGRLPHLSILIDEVHHAADGEVKLRQVVERWAESHTFCSVLGFSGTPFLGKPETVALAGDIGIKSADLQNVVYYYPLTRGIGNFLKTPAVKYADGDSLTIVRDGVGEFLDRYATTAYPDGTCAKLAIYCGQIETLEEVIYPAVAEIVTRHGLDASKTILKYHGGNKTYPQPEEARLQFAALDTDLSAVRVVLLVQIGKEGWDCKSLTGVILPHKGVCPTGMVLQTSCRCLRQVTPGAKETALIWLGKTNAETLDRQLRQQQHITLSEFCAAHQPQPQSVRRHIRTDRFPDLAIDYYQLEVKYGVTHTDDARPIADRLQAGDILSRKKATVVHQGTLQDADQSTYEMPDAEEQRPLTFESWLRLISRESMGALTFARLYAQKDVLAGIFGRITTTRDGMHLPDPHYDQALTRSRIRQAFFPKRVLTAKEQRVQHKVLLFDEHRLRPTLRTANASLLLPDKETTQEIIREDKQPQRIILTKEQRALIEELKAKGIPVNLGLGHRHPERLHTYPYLPYLFRDQHEKRYFSEILLSPEILKARHLEAYYLGEERLTDFRIDCYRRRSDGFSLLGRYTPRFVLVSRTADKTVDKVLLIETRDSIPASIQTFVHDDFVPYNNKRYGLQRFAFLRLGEGLSAGQMREATMTAVEKHF